jgi:hypothetical protein
MLREERLDNLALQISDDAAGSATACLTSTSYAGALQVQEPSTLGNGEPYLSNIYGTIPTMITKTHISYYQDGD